MIQMFENSRYTEHYKPTIGADLTAKIITVDDIKVQLSIWDTAGQERFKSMGTNFYRGADCCLIVYDLTDKETWNNVADWKETFLLKTMEKSPDTFPFIIVGNKVDVADSHRQV